MDTCPNCAKPLDPQLHFVRGSLGGTLGGLQQYLLGWEWPSQRRARKFTVRCPSCTKTYVSHSLRRFGFITYGNYVTVVGIACAVAVCVVLLGTRLKR